ncbi:MAG: hypothetical protein FWG58_02195 [Methanomassiliicoccaceae archaeon]|nr:hypothetical protein [Methanomassiliicoccaceae archaeon]
MQLIDFVDACDLRDRTEMEIFELLSYYFVKENGPGNLTVRTVHGMYPAAGLTPPDTEAVEKEVKKYTLFRPYGIEGTLRFKRNAFRTLDNKYGHLWVSVPSKVRGSAETTKAPVLRLALFADACDIASKTETEAFELFCYYLMKKEGSTKFSLGGMLSMYSDAGLDVPDRRALEKSVRERGSLRARGVDGLLEFDRGILRSIEERYGDIFERDVQVACGKDVLSDSEVIPEDTFCGKRGAFDRLIVQINSAYRDGHFDACALTMRRLLRTALILSFQIGGIEDMIRNGDGYVNFRGIVEKALEADALGLSGKERELRSAAAIGDYSEKGVMYTMSVIDINSARLAYREILEMLLKTAGSDRIP